MATAIILGTSVPHVEPVGQESKVRLILVAGSTMAGLQVIVVDPDAVEVDITANFYDVSPSALVSVFEARHVFSKKGLYTFIFSDPLPALFFDSASCSERLSWVDKKSSEIYTQRVNLDRAVNTIRRN